MGLETGTYINDLVVTNPPSTDLTAQGDDHLRLIKTVLKNTFPGASKVFAFPSSISVAANTSVPGTSQNATYLVGTGAGATTLTLPALTGADAGWEFSVIKASYDANPVFLLPASGNIRTGYLEVAKARRSIPYARTRVMWDGGQWWADRCIGLPVCTLVPYAGGALPPGFEWANGQTLALASTNYQEYFQVRGSGVTPDLRGRVIAGKDDQGTSSANRLTGLSGGLNGDTFEATGGEEAHVTSTAEMPSHTHTANVNDPQHAHPSTDAGFMVKQGGGSFAAGAGTGNQQFNASFPNTTGNAATNITVTNVAQGGGGAHNNVQPTIIEHYVIVVE